MMRLVPLSLALLFTGAGPLHGQSNRGLPGQSCELGDLRSCAILGLVHETGAAGRRDLSRALELYRRACDREVGVACARLALATDDPVALPEDEMVRIGRVADAETGAPVPEAVVFLPDIEVRVVADEAGRVDLGRLPRGRHRILVQRFGYERVDGDLPVPWPNEFLLLMQPTELDEAPTVGRIFGQVTEEGTARGLAAVEVLLASGRPLATTTNQEGRFALPGLLPGTYEVEIRRLGYQTRTATVTVEAGRTTEVFATLSANPIQLEPIEVTVGSAYLERSGVYLRARRGGGALVTRRDLDRIDPILMSEVLSRIPGISLVQRREGVEAVTRRQLDTAATGPCPLLPYLDGVRMTDWDLDLVAPDALEAIEVYTGPDTPVEYGSPFDAQAEYHCGVVLIWTTRGAQTAR